MNNIKTLIRGKIDLLCNELNTSQSLSFVILPVYVTFDSMIYMKSELEILKVYHSE